MNEFKPALGSSQTRREELYQKFQPDIRKSELESRLNILGT